MCDKLTKKDYLDFCTNFATVSVSKYFYRDIINKAKDMTYNLSSLFRFK